eukprot:2632006-Prymnesium_polylepis.1
MALAHPNMALAHPNVALAHPNMAVTVVGGRRRASRLARPPQGGEAADGLRAVDHVRPRVEVLLCTVGEDLSAQGGEAAEWDRRCPPCNAPVEGAALHLPVGPRRRSSRMGSVPSSM